MTERLYLHDAYTSSFVARIVERVLLTDGRLAVVLDRTAFCPGVSGLLGDRGALNRAVRVARVDAAQAGKSGFTVPLTERS